MNKVISKNELAEFLFSQDKEKGVTPDVKWKRLDKEQQNEYLNEAQFLITSGRVPPSFGKLDSY